MIRYLEDEGDEVMKVHCDENELGAITAEPEM